MLELKKCQLKDLNEEHLKLVWRWRNQSFIRDMMFHHEYIEWENHLKWFEKICLDESVTVKLFYYNGEPMGLVSLNLIENNDSIQEWGFYIGNAQATKGMGTLLGITLLDEYFADPHHKLLKAKVIEFNIKSMCFHEKIGFEKYKIVHDSYERNLKKYDVHHFSINRERWQQKRQELIIFIRENADK